MEKDWSKQEKDVFLTLLQVSATVIESKEKNLSSKMVEWHSVQKKFKELTGKKRTLDELKTKWEDMKASARSHLQRGKSFDLSKFRTELQIDFEPPKLCFESDENLGSSSSRETLSGETSTGKRKRSEVENESKAESDKRQAFLEEEFKLKKFVLEKEIQCQDFRHKLEIEILGLKKKIMLRRLDLLNQKRISKNFGVNKNRNL